MELTINLGDLVSVLAILGFALRAESRMTRVETHLRHLLKGIVANGS